MTSSDNEDYSFVPVSSVHVSEKYNKTGIRMAPTSYVARKGKKIPNKVHCKVRKRKNYLLHFFLIIRYILLPQFSKNVQNICLRLTETGV